MEERPPLGVIPKVLWYEQRILDLSRAIHEYVASGRFEQPYWWACELMGLLRMRERHLENPPAESNTVEARAHLTTGQS
jgi:hypothetical protein